jgi:tripartite-type tricarboxylate transporter receptor subunit TctC
MLNRFIKLVVTSLFTLQIGTAASANEYPDKPITIVFPNKAGSGYHNILLALLEEVKDRVPQSVTVTAMPGAGTSAGTRFVQKKPDDGYTLSFIHEAIFTTSALGMLGFNTLDEFDPIARVNTTCGALWAHADAPYDTLAELAAYSVANPKSVRASINTGAISHVEILSLIDLTGADLVPVHVGGGTSGFVQAALAGDVDVFSADPPSVKGLLDSGDIKAITYYGSQRHSILPDIGTIADQKFGDRDLCIGGYFWIRKSAPEEAKTFWHDAIRDTMTDETVARLSETLSVDFGFLGEPEIGPLVEEKFKIWSGLIKAAGIGN